MKVPCRTGPAQAWGGEMRAASCSRTPPKVSPVQSKMTEFIFKPLEERDFPLLLEWLQRSHVKEWWNDGDDTLEKVRIHYSRNVASTKRFILMDFGNGEPLGYFPCYLQPDATVGIDQFLADSGCLNRGLGTAAIRAFIATICRIHSAARIVTDPHPSNARAIRCYEKVGFRHTGTVTAPACKPAYVMELQGASLASMVPLGCPGIQSCTTEEQK